MSDARQEPGSAPMRQQKKHIYHWLVEPATDRPGGGGHRLPGAAPPKNLRKFMAFRVFKIENNVSAIHNAATAEISKQTVFQAFP
ncbi:hypothetical protein [Achromobacter sp.]|uniref:hypothetical protein n=1 Tax=Achromobacter sp. TaxID=134375 RepID=UPI002F952F8A